MKLGRLLSLLFLMFRDNNDNNKVGGLPAHEARPIGRRKRPVNLHKISEHRRRRRRHCRQQDKQKASEASLLIAD